MTDETDETQERRGVTQEQVVAAFKRGGYTIDERFPECGFVYFPASEPRTKDNPDQGRIFWNIKKHKYEDDTQRRIDEAIGVCQDTVEISASWGFPSEQQQREIVTLLTLYVRFSRQQRKAG
jgi:hypothetical protein